MAALRRCDEMPAIFRNTHYSFKRNVLRRCIERDGVKLVRQCLLDKSAADSLSVTCGFLDKETAGALLPDLATGGVLNPAHLSLVLQLASDVGGTRKTESIAWARGVWTSLPKAQGMAVLKERIRENPSLVNELADALTPVQRSELRSAEFAKKSMEAARNGSAAQLFAVLATQTGVQERRETISSFATSQWVNDDPVAALFTFTEGATDPDDVREALDAWYKGGGSTDPLNPIRRIIGTSNPRIRAALLEPVYRRLPPKLTEEQRKELDQIMSRSDGSGTGARKQDNH